MGMVVVEIRRFVRLGGEGVVCPRFFASLGCLPDTGGRVGSLAEKRLVQRAWRLVKSDDFWSCLTVFSIESVLGGYGVGKLRELLV